VTTKATPDQPWRARANCRGIDPQLFFPERGEDQTNAKAVCAGCQVRLHCLVAGLDEHHGIWGGTSERERRRLRRNRSQRTSA
jgi:WhiB family redox-sensing transcriptional regulator